MGCLKLKALLQCLLVISLVFTVATFQPVAAREDACCEKTVSGDSCVYTAKKNCDTNYRTDYTSCDKTAFCKPVCCVDGQTGVCYKQVSASACSQQGGVIDASNPNCAIPQCQAGCCQIGNQCGVRTQRECQLLTSKYPHLNPSETFDASTTVELICVNKCRQQEEGCCVAKDQCAYTTRGQCSGTFTAGTYCSDTRVACGCKPKVRKGCVEGSDDVYWFDSCGNKEMIADDCDYTKGTKCGLVRDQAVCKSTDCQDTTDFPTNVHDPRLGGNRLNGESWCVYESGTGDYRDRVGSRHYKHLCVNGEEQVGACRDFREEVCVQATVDVDGKKVTNAQCLPNEIYDSTIVENISTVQRGFCFWDPKGASGSPYCPKRDSNELCAEANIKCPVTYVKKNNFASWKCKSNCECETQAFIDNAAKYCKSKGDCGANLNVLGKRSDAGFQVQWKGRIKGQTPTKVSEETWVNWSHFGVFGGMQMLQEAFTFLHRDFDYSSVLQQFLLVGVAVVGWYFLAAFSLNTLGGYSGLSIIFDSLSTVGVSSGGVQALSIAGSAVGGFFGLGLLAYGLTQGDVATSGSGAIMVVAAAAAVLASVPLLNIIGLGVAVLWTVIIGSAKIATKTLEISCEPWVAPTGSSDCEQCDDDPWKVCTEYRCKSLGAGCKYLPEDQKCAAASPNDVVSPVISSWKETLTSEFTLQPTPDGYYIQPAVPVFIRLTFGITTDELSQCKISDAHTPDYKSMILFFGSSAYSIQHNLTVSLPAGKDYTYYARCQDVNGNANAKEYWIQLSTDKQPDLTPPQIQSMSLPNNAFIPVGQKETSLTLFMNEPSVCRWSAQDQAHDSMPVEQAFLCEDEVNDDPLHSTEYLCGTLLTGLQDNQKSQFYFRCKDLAGNEQSQSTSFVLQGTLPLTIVSPTPQGEILSASPTLQVITGGGAEQGKASCTHQQGNFPAIPFFTTGGTIHTHSQTNLALGDYAHKISCTDAAGNKATQEISFSVTVDSSAPKITQIYSDEKTLYVRTNEPSTCAYSTTTNTFTKDQGTLMTGDFVLEHTLLLSEPRYFILCWDNDQNMVGPITVIA